MWETQIKFPYLLAAAQAPAPLQMEEPLVKMYIRSCRSRCLDSSILRSTKMYQFLLPCQVIYPFVNQQRLPQQGQSTQKTNQRINPTHMHGAIARQPGQHSTSLPHLAPLSAERAAAGLVRDLCCQAQYGKEKYLLYGSLQTFRPRQMPTCPSLSEAALPVARSRATPARSLEIENQSTCRISSPEAPGGVRMADLRLSALEQLYNFFLILVGSAWAPHEAEL